MPTVPAQKKSCIRCSTRKPLDQFYVKDKHTGRRDGVCKSCRAADKAEWINANRVLHSKYVKAWQRRNPAKTREISRQFVERHRERLNAEARNSYAEKRRDKKAEYRKANAEKHRQSAAEYRAAHQAEIKAGRLRYYSERRAEITERQREWRKANPERYLQIHRGWKQRNVDTCRATAQRRYAKKKGNGGSFTGAEWAAIKAAQDYTCLMCRRREPQIKLTIDHIIPICEGGPNIASNIQGLCRSCNSKKWRKTLDLRQGELNHGNATRTKRPEESQSPAYAG